MSSSPTAGPRVHRVPTWLRWALPVVLILIWLAVGYTGGPYFGKIS